MCEGMNYERRYRFLTQLQSLLEAEKGNPERIASVLDFLSQTGLLLEAWRESLESQIRLYNIYKEGTRKPETEEKQ